MIKGNRKTRGQEEMVGFGLIIIIVAIIILIFLRFSLTEQKSNIESFEADNFVFGFLQHTTDCKNNQKFLNVKELIFECYNEKRCEDGRIACEILNSTLTNIIEKSWDVNEGSQYQGYKLIINSNQANLINMSSGKLNGNSKGTSQDFSRSGNEFQILFGVYEG